MNRIEIIATIDNKASLGNFEFYKRQFYYEKCSAGVDGIILSFLQIERRKINDFFKKIEQIGYSESFFLHFIEGDKCFEVQISNNKIDATIKFQIICINKMIRGNVLEI